MQAVDVLVELAQEADRLEVLAAAEDVRDPVVALTRVVAVEHRGDGVDAQAVDVVPLEPEQRRRQQEAADLVAPEVEDERAPIGVLALARVGVLVQVGAVEVPEPVLVGGEVGRHPVEDDRDPGLVEGVDQRHEVLRGAVAGGRREVPGGLVAPRAVERVLGHRQQLDVREPEPLHVLGQQWRDLAVAQRAIAVVGHAAPGSQVHLVDRDRRVEGAARAPGGHPVRVAPARTARSHTTEAVRGGVSAQNATGSALSTA